MSTPEDRKAPGRDAESYEGRRAKALAMGGPEKVARRKAAGVLNVRERVDALVDAGTFIESGLFGVSGTRPEDKDKSPADGKVAGFGKVDGRECAIVANDFTVMGASSGATNGRKIGHVKRVATSRGLPMIFLGESSGARMPDHMGSRGMGALLGNDPTQYARMRETPWVSATLGLSYGSSSWYAVLSDFSVIRKGAVLAVSSAQLASLAIKEAVDPEVMGGWKVHAEVTGFADAVVETDEEAMQAIKRFLSYLPSHHNEAPPVAPVPAGSGAGMRDVLRHLPQKRTQVYDVRKVARCCNTPAPRTSSTTSPSRCSAACAAARPRCRSSPAG
jgi:acetyl-CoA carboxylase carboxyltransferase component